MCCSLKLFRVKSLKLEEKNAIGAFNKGESTSESDT